MQCILAYIWSLAVQSFIRGMLFVKFLLLVFLEGPIFDDLSYLGLKLCQCRQNAGLLCLRAYLEYPLLSTSDVGFYMSIE
jgi:hypothetical protein